MDGPIAICRCVSDTLRCGMTDGNDCYFHGIFTDVSKTIQDKLESFTFEARQTDDHAEPQKRPVRAERDDLRIRPK